MGRKGKTFVFGRKKRLFNFKKSNGAHASKAEALGFELDDDSTSSRSRPPSPGSGSSETETVTPVQLDSAPASSESIDERSLQNEDDDVQMPLETSRSEQKLSTFAEARSPSEPSEVTEGRYYLVHSSFMDSMLGLVFCPHCFGQDISILTSGESGLAVRFRLECRPCKTTIWAHSSSPKAKRHDINVRAVVASKECGVTYTTMKAVFNILNIANFLHRSTWQDICLEVRDAAMSAAEDTMTKSAAVVRERHQAGVYSSDQTSPSGVQVIGVSYDGTWHKRGHSSHYGVGVAIDINSGFVLDTEVISNFCAGCRQSPPESSPDFEEWNKSHAAVCHRNFDGTSNTMEARAAEAIFGRSVERRELVYGTMLCDGDSKALCRVNDSKCYDIPVRKEDCVNHIAKRIYNQLEQVKKNNKQKLNRKLTAAKIKKITNTYATNLRKHAPNVEQMKLGVMGGLFHMMSTDQKPNHRLCPDGETSWCRYKRAEAKGEAPPPHNPTLSTDVGAFVFPIIKRLTDPELLARCAKMTTQNPNESFNATIWKRCPKVLFAHLPTVQTAVALAVINFNAGPAGLKDVFMKLGLTWSNTNHKFALGLESQRKKNSRRKGKSASKWRRKHLTKEQLAKADTREVAEGVTYSSGGFNC